LKDFKEKTEIDRRKEREDYEKKLEFEPRLKLLEDSHRE
jgi:hypothetical protein